MRDDDGLRIRHMLDAANEALTFARGRTRADLDSDRMLALALVKCIEIIGEAAARVTAAGRQAHPTIPWANIVAMRNRLIHAYFDIDMDRVWDTLVDDLPPLVSALRAVQTEDEPAQ
jgi:uncharacterized protein with HEPN domain